MTVLYWSVYDGTTDPTDAQEIIDGVWTGSGNVFTGNDVAPTTDTVAFQGAPITGLTPSTSYKLAGVWNDPGAGNSNFVITDAFVTPPLAVDIDVNPVTANLQIATPAVEVQYFLFTNIFPVTVNLDITTPQVAVEVFEDIVVQPVTADLRLSTPPVDVEVQIDINVEPQTVFLNITTPPVQVVISTELLIATEAAPLAFRANNVVSVNFQSKEDALEVRAWRNEFDPELDPFPAVIATQPGDRAVIAPNPASFTIAAENVAGYQWYVDDQPQIGETTVTFTIQTTQIGTYRVRCIAVNDSDIGIASREATLTVT